MAEEDPKNGGTGNDDPLVPFVCDTGTEARARPVGDELTAGRAMHDLAHRLLKAAEREGRGLAAEADIPSDNRMGHVNPDRGEEDRP
ncbi:dsRBD fold-containing protein [Streptomyces shenzhenensis]|uniref:dsRBD fold-containing protein n=1 Tax=Streptomyces shenzhenensis TaxID=943815 RepID=UPI00382D5256